MMENDRLKVWDLSISCPKKIFRCLLKRRDFNSCNILSNGGTLTAKMKFLQCYELIGLHRGITGDAEKSILRSGR